MQRHLLLLLLSATAILAMPQQPQVCTGGSYELCVAGVVCVQSFPESCRCGNAAIDKCAQACGMPDPAPERQDCGDEGSVQPPQQEPSVPSPQEPSEPSPGLPPKDDDGNANCSNDEEEKCMTDCLGDKVCPVLFPAQCSCRNCHVEDCAMQCKVKDFEGQLDDCSVEKLEGNQASWKERGNRCGGL